MDFIKEAENAASVMSLYDFEGELVATVTAETDLHYFKHHADVNGRKMFFGWNVYARIGQDLKLLETCGNRDLARNLINSVEKGLAFGAVWFRLPWN